MTQNGSIVLKQHDLDDLANLGDMLISSGFFKDSTKVAQAAVKVLAGRELGLGPVESMRAFHIVEGKVEMSADLLAQRVKSHEKYDYRVIEMTDDKCAIRFYEVDLNAEGEYDPILGTSTFTIADAKRAGLVRPGGAWEKYPRNMLFARAMSNGVGWFCPDVAGGARIYVEGEISGIEGQPTDDEDPEKSESTIIEVGRKLEALAASADPVITVDTETGEINPADQVSGDTAAINAERMATRPQLNRLFALAGELGYDDDERKDAAGVASFKDLTVERASELIQAWTDLTFGSGEAAGEVEPEDHSRNGEGAGVAVDSASPALPDEGSEPPTEAQWEIALRHFDGNRNKVLAAAAVVLERTVSAKAITRDELTEVVAARLSREV